MISFIKQSALIFRLYLLLCGHFLRLEILSVCISSTGPSRMPLLFSALNVCISNLYVTASDRKYLQFRKFNWPKILSRESLKESS